MSFKVSSEIEYETVECPQCGHLIVLSTFFVAQRRKDHANFYCPNGHSAAYSAKPKEELLREDKARLVSELDQERAARARAEQKLARVGRGVCPECNRTFKNLARHRKCKHAES